MNLRMVRKSTLIIGFLMMCIICIPLTNTTQLENLVPSRNSKSFPEKIKELSSDEIILSYITNTNSTPTPISDGALIEGDHVVLTASAPTILDVDNCTMTVTSGFLLEESKDLVIPIAYYDPYAGIIDTYQFSWIFISGIKNGDWIEYNAVYSNSDCDLMAWWTDTYNSTWTFLNNILSGDLGSDSGNIHSDRDGTIAFGCYNYDLQPGYWNLSIDTRMHEGEFSSETDVSVDTYDFMRNNTYQLEIEFCTITNQIFNRSMSLIVNNLFSPCIESIVVAGAGAVKTVVWIYSDLNANDEHAFEVHLSSDGGLSFQLLASRLTDTSYDWDSTGWMILDYIIQVRTFDNDPLMNPTGLETGSYWPGLSDRTNSDPFEAGTWTAFTTTTYPWCSYYTPPDTPSVSTDTTSPSFTSATSISTVRTSPSSSPTTPSTTSTTDTTPLGEPNTFIILGTAVTVGSIAVIVIFSVLIVVNRNSFSRQINV
ncbi:MAG: hypothetical protein RTU30_12830 [Candidatus Thorarchaeota archaeon]